MWHLRGVFVFSKYVAIGWQMRVADCCFVLLICEVMWGLYVDYSSSAVVHTYSVACIFVQGHRPVI